jgi:hypothetical protein
MHWQPVPLRCGRLENATALMGALEGLRAGTAGPRYFADVLAAYVGAPAFDPAVHIDAIDALLHVTGLRRRWLPRLFEQLRRLLPHFRCMLYQVRGPARTLLPTLRYRFTDRESGDYLCGELPLHAKDVSPELKALLCDETEARLFFSR